jgi:FAD/FMN-containing dehydrogenase
VSPGDFVADFFIQCRKIETELAGKVQYPGDLLYNSSLSTYWSAQEQSIDPFCVVLPTSPRDVSTVVKVLVAASCKFAVKGGGHMAHAGAANIEDWVTLDLSGLNHLKLSSDQTLVSIGSGLRWGQVYTKLEAKGLAVIGARSADVGVGGLLLGGMLLTSALNKGETNWTLQVVQAISSTTDSLATM